MPRLITARQSLALQLIEAGCTHEQAARRLGIRHRQAAGRLISRAVKAQQAVCRAAERFIADGGALVTAGKDLF